MERALECSDAVVKCEYLACVSTNVCEAAEVPEEMEAAWDIRVPWPRYSTKLTFQHYWVSLSKRHSIVATNEISVCLFVYVYIYIYAVVSFPYISLF